MHRKPQIFYLNIILRRVYHGHYLPPGMAQDVLWAQACLNNDPRRSVHPRF